MPPTLGPETALSRLKGLRFPQTAYEVVEAVEAMQRATAVSLLAGGDDPWARSAVSRGADVVALGLFAVAVGPWHWPVLFFDVTPKGTPNRRRLVSLTMPMLHDADMQARAPWQVRSFTRLRPRHEQWMGDPAGGTNLVNGDRQAASTTPPTRL